MSAPTGGAVFTPDNKGAGVILATFIPMPIIAIVVILKVGSKIVKIHVVQLDDYIVTFSMILAVIQGVAISRQVHAGLGRHIDSLSSLQIKAYQHAGYITEFFYIFAMTGSKASTLYFILDLSVKSSHRRVALGALVGLGVWAIVATFGVAFQCSHAPSGYWAIISNKCFDQAAFWATVESFGMVLDFTMIGLLSYVVWTLQMPWSTKAIVIGAFSSRLIEIPLAILRVIYISDTRKSSDRPWDDFPQAVVTQVLVNVSIIVACVPFLKTFMEHLQPGWSTGAVRTWYGINATRSGYKRQQSSGYDRSEGPEAYLLDQTSFSSKKPIGDGGYESIGVASAEPATTPAPQAVSDGPTQMVITQQRDVTVIQE